MINIRVAEEKDKNKILTLLDKEELKGINLNNKKLHNSMVVCDGDKIIGYSNYNEIPDQNTALIETLIIEGDYQRQHLGDGLIKSLLNLADKRQIKKVYAVESNNNSMFLKKVGLTKRKLKKFEGIGEYFEDGLFDDTVEVFEAILPDFFNKACKSEG